MNLMRWFREADSAGWGFFGIATLLYAGPCMWISMAITNDELTVPGRLLVGLILALISAAFTAYIANELLFRRAVRREAAGKSASASSPPTAPRPKK